MDQPRSRVRWAPVALAAAAAVAGPALCLTVTDGIGRADGGGATVVGRVLYKGTVPPAQEIDVTRDADVCGAKQSLQLVSIDAATRGLQQAVVSVEGAPSPGEAPASETVSILNQKCAFATRIMTARIGATLEIKNADPVMHNTHVRLDKRTFLNVALVSGGRPVQKPVKVPGLMNVQCDRHKFMQGYVLAFDHPFHILTDATGQFRLSGVPAGTRTITVWHETLGTVKKDIQVPASGEVQVMLEVGS